MSALFAVAAAAATDAVLAASGAVGVEVAAVITATATTTAECIAFLLNIVAGRVHLQVHSSRTQSLPYSSFGTPCTHTIFDHVIAGHA